MNSHEQEAGFIYKCSVFHGEVFEDQMKSASMHIFHVKQTQWQKSATFVQYWGRIGQISAEVHWHI